MSSDVQVQIILPEGAYGGLERPTEDMAAGLRVLTKAIRESHPRGTLYGMGGEFGYGEDFENDTFMMHPFCWCEQDTCPWCGGCRCTPAAWDYFIDGNQVLHAEYHAFYQQHGVFSKKKGSNPDELRRVTETKPRPDCDYCLGRGVFARFGGEAPNFWHKSTSLKVTWYKWIGRDMDVANPNGVLWPDVLADCVRSLPRLGRGPRRASQGARRE